MRLRIAGRIFAPRAWAALLTAAALAAFVSLGWWQVGRGREKQALIESFARGTQSSVELTGDVTVDDLPRFQHVRVLGRYDPARQVLIDNMPSQAGRPGYRVLTPFVRDGAERLLEVVRARKVEHARPALGARRGGLADAHTGCGQVVESP